MEARPGEEAGGEAGQGGGVGHGEGDAGDEALVSLRSEVRRRTMVHMVSVVVVVVVCCLLFFFFVASCSCLVVCRLELSVMLARQLSRIGSPPQITTESLFARVLCITRIKLW